MPFEITQGPSMVGDQRTPPPVVYTRVLIYVTAEPNTCTFLLRGVLCVYLFPYAEIEELLDNLAGRVLQRKPTIGYMRSTLDVYAKLKQLVPRPGDLTRLMTAASMHNGSKNTLER